MFEVIVTKHLRDYDFFGKSEISAVRIKYSKVNINKKQSVKLDYLYSPLSVSHSFSHFCSHCCSKFTVTSVDKHVVVIIVVSVLLSVLLIVNNFYNKQITIFRLQKLIFEQ